MSNNKRVVSNKSKFNLNSCLKYKFTELLPDLKSRAEIVCAEQIVGLYARQAVMTLRNVPACAACTVSDNLVAESRFSKHEDMMVATTCFWLNDRWLTKSTIMIRSI